MTLDGSPSEDVDAGFVNYSYVQLLAVLKVILGQRKAQLPEAVSTFLTQYIETLWRLTTQDESLINLCRGIYRRHRKAIDLIVQYGMASVFNEVACDIIGKGDCEILSAGPKIV